MTRKTSDGFAVVAFAHDVLGITLLPWQRWLLIHALELNLDGTYRFRTFLVLVARQNGKALDVATPILTANRGWTTMAEVGVGDRVYHPGGHDVAVTSVSDVQSGHDCFRVTTTDGRSLVADAEHLWTVTDRRRGKSKGPRGTRNRWFETRTVTTSEMYRAGLSRTASGLKRSTSTGGKAYATSEFRFGLPIQEPVKSADVALPVDPYLLGAWLGDGDSAGPALTCHVDDGPHWTAAVIAAGFIPTDRASRAAVRVGITTTPGPGRHGRSFGGYLRRLGLWGNKHIPEVYLTSGTAQREALLQGLLDTDGSIDGKRGQVEFCSTNRDLADGVLYLARSLGWRATLMEGRATLNGRDCGPKFRVCFTPTREDPFVPFRMPRKAARVKALDGGKGRTAVSIASIEPVESVPVRCIRVDSPDGLFLAGRDLVPTHNSTVMQILALWRMYVYGGSLVIGTAQNLDMAEESWQGAVDMAEGVPELAQEIRSVDRTNGKKTLRLETGERYKVAAASRRGGRGLSGDLCLLDELREHQTWESWAAVTKTTLARPNPQIACFSNAGDAASIVLAHLRRRAIAAIGSSADTSVGIFEWSASDECPMSWDVDPVVVHWPSLAQANPALNHTIPPPALTGALETDDENVYRTEVMCQWVLDLDAWAVVPRLMWDAIEDPSSRVAPDTPVVFSADVDEDRGWGSISRAGARVDGLLHVGPVEHRPGTDWMVESLRDLTSGAWSGDVVVDDHGPAGSLITELEAAGVPVVTTSSQEFARACGQFYDRVMGEVPTVRHSGAAELNSAVAGAKWRPLGDARALARKGLLVSPGPLITCVLAAFGFAEQFVAADAGAYWA